MSQRPVSLPAARLAVVRLESLAIAIQAELATLRPERWPGALARLEALAGAARGVAAEAVELIDGRNGDREERATVTHA
jgi:hypothetical protein